jgi:hypothetical protein
MNHKTKGSALKKEFLRDLKKKLAERNYRADLKLITAAKNTTSTFDAVVKFNPALGYPSEDDLISLVSQSYPQHQITWDLVDVSDTNGTVALVLEPAVEIIPIASLKEIPPEFVSIGAGIYKRAADAAGNITEIWQVKKDDSGGFVLCRSEEDFEVEAEREDSFVAGDVVMTSYGPGKIKKFDDFGNAIVQVGSKKHLVAAAELKDYSADGDRKKLQDYYTQMYGDASFAKSLVEKMSAPKKGETPWLNADLGGKKSKK